LIVSATILVLGVGGAELIFNLGGDVGDVTFSGLGLAALVGIALNALLNWQSFVGQSEDNTSE
jgi:xanthine/uracil permease